MRIYDTRIGKFLSVDPLTKTYPFYSSYLYAGNSPIRFIDVYGEGPGDALEILLKILHETPKVGTKILVEKVARTNIGKAAGKTTAQVYVSTLGLMNGTKSLLSFGLMNTPYERLNLPEEYRAWYDWSSLVGRSQSLPEGVVGPGAGNSPRLEFSAGSNAPTVSAPIAKIKPTPNAYVFSNSNQNGSQQSSTQPQSEARDLLDEALLLQGKTQAPSGYKQPFSKGNYDYLVRVHGPDAKAPPGSNSANNTTFRVSRRLKGVDANGQGSGWEFADDNSNWYKERDIKANKAPHCGE